jgi:F-type H+-transporting ATPase subunit alpha
MLRNVVRQSGRTVAGALAATGRVQAATSRPALNAINHQVRHATDKAAPTEVSSILEQRIRGVQEEAGLAETGRVLSVGYVARTSDWVNLSMGSD